MSLVRVTVVTPTFNSVATLEATIQSVLAQDHPNLHYWIIDGGSTDGTVGLIERYADRLTGWVSEPDRGIYDAMNKGLAQVASGWVYFLGGDDRLAAPDALRTLLIAGEDSAQVLYGDVIRQPSGHRYDGAFDATKLARRNICHQAICYRAELLHAEGGFDLRYPLLADYVFNLRTFTRPDVAWRYVPVVVAYYQEGGATGGQRLDLAYWADREQLFRQSLRSAVSPRQLYHPYGPYVLHQLRKGTLGAGLRYLWLSLWHAGRWDLLRPALGALRQRWQSAHV